MLRSTTYVLPACGAAGVLELTYSHFSGTLADRQSRKQEVEGVENISTNKDFLEGFDDGDKGNPPQKGRPREYHEGYKLGVNKRIARKLLCLTYPRPVSVDTDT